MISDQDLRNAALAYEKTVLESLPDLNEPTAIFSTAFERKMKKLVFRVDHPILYWLRRLLPVFLLTGLLIAGILSLMPHWEYTFLGQPRSMERSAVSGGLESAKPPAPAAEDGVVVYRPTWLPAGCVWVREALYGTEGMIVYRTPDGTEAAFMYAADAVPWSDTDLENGKTVFVGDCPAVLLIGQNKGNLSDLFWIDESSGTAFWISAPLREEDMIKIAESVEGGQMEIE